MSAWRRTLRGERAAVGDRQAPRAQVTGHHPGSGEQRRVLVVVGQANRPGLPRVRPGGGRAGERGIRRVPRGQPGCQQGQDHDRHTEPAVARPSAHVHSIGSAVPNRIARASGLKTARPDADNWTDGLFRAGLSKGPHDDGRWQTGAQGHALDLAPRSAGRRARACSSPSCRFPARSTPPSPAARAPPRTASRPRRASPPTPPRSRPTTPRSSTASTTTRSRTAPRPTRPVALGPPTTCRTGSAFRAPSRTATPRSRSTRPRTRTCRAFTTRTPVNDPEVFSEEDLVQDHDHHRRQAHRLRRLSRRRVEQLRPARLHARRRPARVRRVVLRTGRPRWRPRRPTTTAAWHQVAATLGPAGLDAVRRRRAAGLDPCTTSAQAFTGYWRIGGDNLGYWPDQPSSEHFTGELDEVSVYSTQLTAARISAHYAARTGAGYSASVLADSPYLYWRLGDAQAERSGTRDRTTTPGTSSTG